MRRRANQQSGEIVVSQPRGRRVLKDSLIERAVRLALDGRAVGSVSVALVDDGTMADLHERYLGLAQPTDVLSFDLSGASGDGLIDGEIVVSLDTARREARRRGLPLQQEVLRYVIHGALHLAGLDDRRTAERARMRRAEDRVLAELVLGTRSADLGRGTRRLKARAGGRQ